MTNYTVSGNTNPTVNVAINKNVIAKNKNKVFLADKSEFQIELFNPRQSTVAVSISLNGKFISSSKLVLKPGQRVWLERFIDENRKFIFNTYSVENSAEALAAIAKNGELKVEFFEEVQPMPSFWYTDSWYINNPVYKYNYPKCNDDIDYFCGDFNCGTGGAGRVVNTSYSCSTSKGIVSAAFTGEEVLSKAGLNSIDTGRVEQGSRSNQNFSNYSGDFCTFPFYTEVISILPITAQFLSPKKAKIYCINCGQRIKNENANFCPNCGRRIEK